MESFAAAHQVHLAALRNSAMLGGPFLDYGADKVGEVRALLQATTAGLSPLPELAGVEECRRRGITAELLYGHKEVDLS